MKKNEVTPDRWLLAALRHEPDTEEVSAPPLLSSAILLAAANDVSVPDPWLMTALSHAPDANVVTPLTVDRVILRAAATGNAKPAISESWYERVNRFWMWLAQPPVAAGFATIALSIIVGVTWTTNKIDSPVTEDLGMSAAGKFSMPPKLVAPPPAPPGEEASEAESTIIGALTPEAQGPGTPGLAADVKHEVPVQITFATDSAKLTNEARTVLDTVARAINSDELLARSFRIEGYADSSGTEKGNPRLSQARAEAVVKYLVTEHHVLPQRLLAVGKDSPQLPNMPHPGASENRRVVIVTQAN